MTSLSLSDSTELPPARIAVAFARALDVAQCYVGATMPNPPVGCVLLDRDGNELAAAAHHKAGEWHAEALALQLCAEAGTTAAIHTAVVTLEPCNHHGRTPPCSEALLATPVRTVWVACSDPNSQVAGGGAARLAEAGVTVRFLSELATPDAAEMRTKANRLIAPFAKRSRTGLPFVVVKQALNGAGSMVPPAGQTTFTSEKSLDLAHRLRREADAILTGSGTILADAPAFTVRRIADHAGKRRPLVILDRRERVAENYLAGARARGFVPAIATDLATALAELGAAGCLSVLIEAGPSLTQTILASTLWDEHVLIEQAAGGGADRVTTRLRTPSDIIGKNHDVFRHH